MKAVVTGGSGKAGTYAIRELLEHGYAVTNIDRVAPAERLCPFVRVDLTDMGQVYGAMVGHDGVVHLAAIPAPTGWPPEVVFHNNVMSTFNVVEAGTSLGMKRVTIALFVPEADEETLQKLSADTSIEGVDVQVAAIGWCVG